jgi:MFS family permease
VTLDTLTGWFLDGTGTHRVHADVEAQRVYRASLVVTALGLLLCLILVASPVRWKLLGRVRDRTLHRQLRGSAVARRLAAGAAVVAVSWFFGGLTGLIAAVAGLAIAARFGPRWVAAAAFGSLVVSAIATVAEVAPNQSYSVTFANERPIATNAALVAGALALTAVVVFASRERRSEAQQRDASAIGRRGD